MPRGHIASAAVDSSRMAAQLLPPNQLLVARLREVMHGEWPLRLAVLFGSAASDRQRDGSDVDVAILPLTSEWSESVERELYVALTRAARTEVDLVDIERAPTLLLWEIATTGRALLERGPGEFARFRARAASEYIDFAPAFAHYYGEIFRRRLIDQERGG
jgi:predicted nucleotidyltransferase